MNVGLPNALHCQPIAYDWMNASGLSMGGTRPTTRGKILGAQERGQILYCNLMHAWATWVTWASNEKIQTNGEFWITLGAKIHHAWAKTMDVHNAAPEHKTLLRLCLFIIQNMAPLKSKMFKVMFPGEKHSIKLCQTNSRETSPRLFQLCRTVRLNT